MPKIGFDPKFEKSYRSFVSGSSVRKEKISKTLLLFERNPKHPSLNVEKLLGSDIWTIRIDSGNRMFFVWNKNKDTAIFFMVGKHDLYKKIR